MLKEALQHVTAIQTLYLFFVGLLLWSSVEYGLHRFVFHLYTYSTNWNIFHFFAHGIHHLTPNDSTRLTFPPLFSAVIMFLVSQIPQLIPPSSGVHAWIAGLACGFMLYDAIHYYFHHGDAPWLPTFLKRMKSAHLNHHYKNDSMNFGVTSPLFDWIFGTYERLNV
jgi:4-hydroxysphinganine ceramide fatty acyl 2-hydroxylase